jgi:hypothetical protein
MTQLATTIQKNWTKPLVRVYLKKLKIINVN